MILHALWKKYLLSKKQYGFLTTLADPPDPGMVKDHKKYGDFFRNPSPIKLRSAMETPAICVCNDNVHQTLPCINNLQNDDQHHFL